MSVEETLEEVLFGEKKAVSCALLSRMCRTPLSHAKRLTEEFYEKHSNKLDVAYCVVGRQSNPQFGVVSQKLVKIVGADELQKTKDSLGEVISVEIYALSPGLAADPVVLSTLARKVQNIDVGATPAELKAIGLIVNPAVDDSKFATDAMGRATLDIKKDTIDNSSKATHTDTQKGQANSAKISSASAEVTPKHASASTNTAGRGSKTPKSTNTRTKTESETKSKAQPKPQKPFSFNKTTKEQAHAQAFAPSRPKVVNEAVVIADEVPDAASDVEMESSSKREDKNQQFEQLQNLFKEDIEMNGDSDSGAEEGHLEEESEPEVEDVEIEPEVMEIEPEVVELEPEDVSQQEAKPDSTSPGVSDQGPRDNGNHADAAGENRPTRRRVEVIKHREEDGMIVSYKEHVWEDIPDTDVPPAKPKSKSPFQNKTPLPQVPKKKTGKQASLTSFFKKK